MSLSVLIYLSFLVLAYFGYQNSFESPFIFDDQVIYDNVNIKNPASFLDIFKQPYDSATFPIRPLIALTFAANFSLGELNVFGYHVANFLIHVTAGFFLFLILEITLSHQRFSEKVKEKSRPFAYTISLLWLLHPVHTESVTYIAQRAQSMMGLFYLATLYFSIRSYFKKKFMWFVLAFASCYLGTLCKAIMVTVPIAVIFYDGIFLYPSLKESIKKRWSHYLGLFSSWFVTLSLTLLYVSRETHDIGVASVFDYLLTQTEVILHYIQLVLWPTNLCFDYTWPLVSDWKEVIFPIIIVLSLLILTLCFLFTKRKWMSYLGIWFFLILSPTSSFLPISDAACERYLYLPSIAIVCFVVFSLSAVVDFLFAGIRVKKNVKIIGVACALAVFTSLTYARNEDYKTVLKMWTDTVEKAPHNYRAKVNLAGTLYHEGHKEESVELFEAVIERAEQSLDNVHKRKELAHYIVAHAYFQLGVIYSNDNRINESIALLKKSLDLRPRSFKAHNALAYCYVKQKKYPEAVGSYLKSIELNQYNEIAYTNISNCYMAMNAPRKAITYLLRAVKISPQKGTTYYSLGYAFELDGQIEKAIGNYRTALSYDPNLLRAKNQLNRILKK